MSGQERLEEHMKKTDYENNVVQKETLNGMMNSETVEGSYEDKTLTMLFPIQPWQANRAGGFHGGAFSMAFDMSIAALARFLAGENFAPTVSLDVKYVRPVEIGDSMLIKVKATAAGRRLSQFTAEAFSKNTGKLVATAASVYLNVDTSTKK